MIKKARDRSLASRRRRLALYPLCAHCLQSTPSIIRKTDEIDHVIPLQFGGEDVDDNCQGLCLVCHTLKTAKEGGGFGGLSEHPEWLCPSIVPLTIVFGPPCSGKSQYVAQRAQANDIVIDFNDIMARLDTDFRAWSSLVNPRLVAQTMRVRNSMLGSLAQRESGHAWFVSAAASPSEQEWWSKKLAAKIRLLNPGSDECYLEASKRGCDKALTGISDWYRESYETWRPKRKRLKKVAFDAKGFPIDFNKISDDISRKL